LIEADQLTNFISPKYISIPADSVKTTEANPPGFRTTVYKSTSATAAGVLPAEAATTDQYVFDFKTGVLSWVSGQQPNSSQYVYMSVYQYIGRTLATQQTAGYSGSFSGSFQGNGSGLTNLPASSIVGLNLTRIADQTVSASVSATSNPLTLISSSVDLLTVNNHGEVFANLFTGSFEGDGYGLYNVPASGIVGLNLSQVASGSVTASISPDKGFVVNTNSTITGSLLVTGSITSDGNVTITPGNDLYTNAVKENTTNAGISYVAGTNQHRFTGSVNLQDSLIVRASASFLDTTITGSLLVTQNFIVLGTASFTQVTGSSIAIGANLITLNTDDPVVRFGGITVADSGSFGNDSTGSLLWDSERNHWIYSNPTGTTYNSAGIMSGPRNTGSLGSETYPAHYSVLRGQGGDHLEGSNIYSSGSNLTINKGTTGSLAGVEILGDLEVTGSTRFTGGVSGSFSGSFQGFITGSINVTGSLSGSIFGNATLNSLNVIGTSSLNGPVNINGTVVITSSTPARTPDNDSTIGAKYSIVTSQSMWHYSDNIGYPIGENQWQYNLEGSYFNLFNHNTDTATIVRFIAGFLSASTPAPLANARIYNGVTETVASSTVGSQPAGYVSHQHNSSTIQYLIDKGFAAVGQKLFYSIGSYISDIQTNSSLSYTFTNKATGTYTVSSSNTNSDLLFGSGLLSDNVSVSASRSWKFIDNSSSTIIHASASQFITTNTTLNTTNAQGLYRAAINTAAPRVIPNTFQDSRFSGLATNYAFTSSINFSNSSSTGYYELTASIGVGTASLSTYNFTPTDATRRFKVFYAPLTHISASISVASPSGLFTPIQRLTIVSRSLSGAPYMTSATYATNITASNCFDPMYNDGTIAIISLSGTDVSQTGNTSGVTVSGRYNTANVFYNAAGNLQGTNTIPTSSDVVRLNSSITFTAAAGTNNFTNKSTLSPSSFTLTGTGYNRLGNTNVMSTTSSVYHVAGDFGQPLASGSMAFYGRASGFDNSSATFTKTVTGTENFSGETYRRNISNDVLTFNLPGGTIWNSGSALGSKDLQVAPAKLVDPGSTSGYWYPASYGDTTKYYIREIQYASGGSLSSITVSTGTNIIPWSSTSDGWSIALLLESQKDSGAGATLLAYESGSAAITGPFSVASGYQNPFTSTVNIVYNPVVSPSTGTHTVTLSPAGKGQSVDNGNRIFIIARLKNSSYGSHSVPTSLTIVGG
jgi:hypothetical protein